MKNSAFNTARLPKTCRAVFFPLETKITVTNFNVNSALVAFAPIVGSFGSASAGVTVTDTSGNGASLTGNFPGATSFQAEFNNGAVFADLVAPAVAPGATALGLTVLANLRSALGTPSLQPVDSKSAGVPVGLGTLKRSVSAPVLVLRL